MSAPLRVRTARDEAGVALVGRANRASSKKGAGINARIANAATSATIANAATSANLASPANHASPVNHAKARSRVAVLLRSGNPAPRVPRGRRPSTLATQIRKLGFLFSFSDTLFVCFSFAQTLFETPIQHTER